MAQKQFLHELLKEDQEPFRLKNYIADRRSRLKKSSPPPTNLQLGKRKPNPIHEASTNRRNILCKHACFLSFQNSPDVRKSPFFDFPSPAKSPCKSPNGAVFLHIPTKTAALLVEAAMRIQKQQQSKPKAQGAKNAGLGLLGSFLKRLKDRSKAKARAISGQTATAHDDDDEETVRMSCSCSNRRPSSANWTESNELDFEASTSSCGSDCSEEIISGGFETRFCTSPFRFNLQKSPPSSGRHTPEFCSPAASPSRRVNQENENYRTNNSDNVQGEEEEEQDKEQCSPVSVFDPPFEDDGRLSGDADEDDDYDLECSYQNVQRAKQQLLYRLRRFEKLAELDTIELERDSLQGSDDEDRSDGDEQLSLYKNMSTDMKKLVSDLITEEKNGIVNSCDNEVVMSRIGNKLDSWREVEPNTIDMMIGFDFKTEFDGWTRFNEQVEDISAAMEVAIFGQLVDELSQELL
ncbi:hypothetical protein PHJA_001901000 [Phtheirospermum japonicum]|uniref:DUF4378 domain-containing protein n=1 Tax=Phtheirospermum japonicum TaxID=374723 RepID=A0A830CET5_9LAMI|nr:hypothetical protein PHJA_001901000 [Phtheirospermum japonicum]